MASSGGKSAPIHDIPELRGRAPCFLGREEAGRALARMLEAYRGSGARVAAIPSGGVPVAAEIARELALPICAVVVSKATLSWNTEMGYGAVASGGLVRLNEASERRLEMTAHEVQEGVQRAKAKVGRRDRKYRGEGPPPGLEGHTVILVDDGLASGFTALVAVEALRSLGAASVVLAVPTAHRDAAQKLAAQVDALYCANVRGGASFAVADAYEHWSDVDEDEAVDILQKARAAIARSRGRQDF